jgi:hypothetical protein
VIALAAAPAAVADGNASANWAGYAAHGANFRLVSAHWRQPKATCVAGKTTYSAMWVGLGGYNLSSSAVEQVGTELDCNPSGHTVSSAWYEVVPQPSHPIPIQVRPGDQVAASVQFAGGAVILALSDLTRHRSFQRTIYPSGVDVSSAEWILEAPSACIVGTSACRTLPLTNFGQATFWRAHAAAIGGPIGTISQGPWVHTRITLQPGGQQFATNNPGGGTPYGTARPSALGPSGAAFKVTYRTVYVQSNPLLGPRVSPGPAYLRH